jgi:hypothetical protein
MYCTFMSCRQMIIANREAPPCALCGWVRGVRPTARGSGQLEEGSASPASEILSQTEMIQGTANKLGSCDLGVQAPPELVIPRRSLVIISFLHRYHNTRYYTGRTAEGPDIDPKVGSMTGEGGRIVQLPSHLEC